MRILVADDDPILRGELAELLRGDGHEVQPAADGEEALRSLESSAFDVALVDLVMPRATGLDILRRLQLARSATSVVIITGHGSVDVAVEAMKAGAVDFLVKPFESDALHRILQGIADERESRRMLTPASFHAEARTALLREAIGRNALLAVVGPDASPPPGASRVLRIDEQANPPNVFTVSQMFQLNAAIDEALGSMDRPVLHASGLRVIEAVHGRNDLKAWVRHTSGRCMARGGVLVLAGMDPRLASDLEAELGLSRTEPDLQGMLESLANPIRRAIVAYVFSTSPAAYSSILRMNFVDSSSKLSFHLQKLQTDRLLEKDHQGAYALTGDGRRAWRVVRALSDEQRRPSVLFDPA